MEHDFVVVFKYDLSIALMMFMKIAERSLASSSGVMGRQIPE